MKHHHFEKNQNIPMMPGERSILTKQETCLFATVLVVFAQQDALIERQINMFCVQERNMC
jgi:hypothetical protein